MGSKMIDKFKEFLYINNDLVQLIGYGAVLATVLYLLFAR
jgi:hypothetical protein